MVRRKDERKLLIFIAMYINVGAMKCQRPQRRIILANLTSFNFFFVKLMQSNAFVLAIYTKINETPSYKYNDEFKI